MRCGLALVLVSTTAAAGAPSVPLSLSATSHASALDLGFRNVTPDPVQLTTYVQADGPSYDFLTVTLTAGARVRVLHFMRSHDKTIAHDETIAPGGTTELSVDLAAWAVRAGNGGPLVPGRYDAAIEWNTGALGCAGRCPTLRATTAVTIPAPEEAECHEVPPSHDGLALLLYQDRDGALEVGVHNVDRAQHCIFGYVKTYEIQSDWMTVEILGHTLHFDDDRDKAYPVMVRLAPGATEWRRWDLAAWGMRERNGRFMVPATARAIVTATVRFDASRERDVWNGKLEAALAIAAP
ncbi:MAG TPA: hypothetical protein VLX92_32755 [Kofleriaceae bacterium]|nr:hypothetical protein [Kofleriaceae bacterium]